MRRFLSYGLLGIGLIAASSYQLSVTKYQPTAIKSQIQYKVYDLPNSRVHTVLIPANSRFQVTVELSNNVDILDTFTNKYQALGVLNAGFLT